MNSKNIGNIGEHLAIVKCLELDIQVSRPLGDNSRYDLVLDIDGMLYTCQIKSTNTFNDNKVQFWLQSSQAHRGNGRQSYNVDCFLLVDIQNKNVFFLTDTDKKNITISYKEEAINWYKDFLLENKNQLI